MLPMLTHTERIPNRLHSTAMPAARFSSAARAAVAWAKPGMPLRGLKPLNTTSPLFRGIIERVATWWVRFHAASTVRRWTARHPFGEISSAGAWKILADNIRRLGESDGISAYFWGSDIRGVAYLNRVRAARDRFEREIQS
jgi:hypothetical protein